MSVLNYFKCAPTTQDEELPEPCIILNNVTSVTKRNGKVHRKYQSCQDKEQCSTCMALTSQNHF